MASFTLNGFEHEFKFLPVIFTCCQCGEQRHTLHFNQKPFPLGSLTIFRDGQRLDLPADTPVACIYCAISKACVHTTGNFCNNCIGYGQFYEGQFFPCRACSDLPDDTECADSRMCLNGGCFAWNESQGEGKKDDEDESDDEWFQAWGIAQTVPEDQVRADMIEYVQEMEATSF